MKNPWRGLATNLVNVGRSPIITSTIRSKCQEAACGDGSGIPATSSELPFLRKYSEGAPNLFEMSRPISVIFWIMKGELLLGETLKQFRCSGRRWFNLERLPFETFRKIFESLQKSLNPCKHLGGVVRGFCGVWTVLAKMCEDSWSNLR